MKPDVTAFFDEATNTITYLVRDPGSRKCAVIDPVLDFDQAAGRTATASADQVIELINSKRLELEWVLETHVHADHISAAPYFKSQLGGHIGTGRSVTLVQSTFKRIFNFGSEFVPDGSQFDSLFDDDEILKLGALKIRVMHTPGHTPSCVTFLIGDAGFVGDTLFMPDFGTARTDFPGGDAATLYQSIRRILDLSADTRLFTCHDYKAPGRDVFAWETTVAQQRAANLHVKDGVSEQEFVAFRTKKDAGLGMPKLLIPSIQINIRAGELPPADDNGVCYLKVPINSL